jgi:hypothetical protein
VCLPRHLNEVQQRRHATVGRVSSRRRQPVKSVNCNRGKLGKGLRTGIQMTVLRMVSSNHQANTRLEKSIQQTLLRTFSSHEGWEVSEHPLYSFPPHLKWLRSDSEKETAISWEKICRQARWNILVRQVMPTVFSSVPDPWHRMVDNSGDCCESC